MRRELASRVRHQVVRGLDWEERTRATARSGVRRLVRSREWRDLVLGSGVFDHDWVAMQFRVVFGRTFETPEALADAYLAHGGFTPHPLFEPDWLDGNRSWKDLGLDALVWYLTDAGVRARSPHPLVDLARVEREVPGAAADPRGPLAAWLDRADADTVVPAPAAYQPVTLREVFARAGAAVVGYEAEMEFVNADRISLRRPRLDQGDLDHARALPDRVPAADEPPLVTVVMPTWNRAKTLRPSIESVLAQSMPSWELLVLDDGSTDDTEAVVTGFSHFDDRVRFVPLPHGGVCRARNAGIEQARGRYVAFLDSDNSWRPDYLAQVVGALEHHGWAMAHGAIRLIRAEGDDRYRAFEGTRGHLLVRNHVDLNVLVARTDALRAIGGLDESLRRAVDYDLVLRLAEHHHLHLVPYVGADYDDAEDSPDRISNRESEHWISVVVDKQVVTWDAAETSPERDPDRTTVVCAVRGDVFRTERWFRRFAESGHDDVDLTFVGVRARRSHHLVATLLASVTPGGRWHFLGSDVSNVVGLNLGASRATAGRVVLTEPQVDPDVDAFRRLGLALAADVAVVQPVVVDRAGLVVSAGAVMGTGSVAPQPFLGGHAQRDARAADGVRLPAALSPVVAVRADVLTRYRGLYPLFGEALGETDLSLRAARDGLGDTVLAADVVLEWTRNEPWGPPVLAPAVKALASRHSPTPALAARSTEAWRTAGLEVVGHHNLDVLRPDRRAKGPLPLETPVLVPRAVVRPLPVATPGADLLFGTVTEAPPRLRWTIDLASPPGPQGRTWGDHHFATSLAAALERLGQRVAVDNRGLRHRGSRDLDDVVLVLRGLDRVEPRPGPAHLMWVISHPDLVTPEEAASYDRVFAASTSWSAATSQAWGLSVEPLLQCTDQTVFHPGRAADLEALGRPAPEVLFVGSSRGVRRPVVDAALAAGAPLTLHGTLWEGLVPPEMIASTYVANADLGAHYASAGVVLNDHWVDMRRDGFLSNRLFDAVACGARVVTDPVAGVEEVFGAQVQVFHDQHDMVRLLADPDAAFPSREACLEGAATVREHHSFDARARTLLDHAAVLASGGGPA